ncbi:MAG: hypothetical protein LBI28_10195 [Treponema sp.]|jgi:hypothetical protein|nr:hypothetical protein [Treponema sp.]
MKKIVYLFLAVFIVFSFISCEEESDSIATPKIPEYSFARTNISGTQYYTITIYDTGEFVGVDFFYSPTKNGIWRPFSSFESYYSQNDFQSFRIPADFNGGRIGFRLTYINQPYTSTKIISADVFYLSQ